MDAVPYVTLVGGLAFLVLLVLVPLAIWMGVQRRIWRIRGRGFAEGWFEVADRHAKDFLSYIPRGVGARPVHEGGTVDVKPAGDHSITNAAPAAPQRYTITGKPIR